MNGAKTKVVFFFRRGNYRHTSHNTRKLSWVRGWIL